MHEQSLVRSLLKQVDAIRREHCAQSVIEIHVEVGPLSGVEPQLLASAYEQQAPDTPAAGAELVIDEVRLVASCDGCNTEFGVTGFDFRCQKCGGHVRVVRGDAFLLTSVSLRSCEPSRETIP